MDSQQIEQTTQQLAELQQQVCNAVIGQQQIVREILVALMAGGHVLIEGVPGLGKTLLVRALTKAVGGNYSRIQFTPDLMPTDISGHAMFDYNSNEFSIRRGPVFSNFVITDEINRAPRQNPGGSAGSHARKTGDHRRQIVSVGIAIYGTGNSKPN